VDSHRNVCYLIHLERPINKSGTQHYIGFALNLSERIAKHRASKGAQVLKHANALGIGWEVVRVWRDGSREAELGLKHFGGKNLCPKCSKFRRVKTGQIDLVQGRT
jgi:predicted GIY-YIG superfamily endonuclease